MATNLTPDITNYTQSLPIKWLTQGVVGQRWAKAVDFINSQLVYQFVQAVQARFPEYMPLDAYGYMAAERQIIKGYNDGYNLSPSLDGSLYPLRVRAARNQWQFAGTALGILLQLHYQGVDAYCVQQNGLAYSLDTSIVSYNCFPPSIKLVCTTGGTLGTAVFSYSIVGGSSGTITTATGVFNFQLPGTQTVLYFPQFNYVHLGETYIDTNGFFTYSQGASSSIQQITGPQNALIVSILDPDPNINIIESQLPSSGFPSRIITITITTGGTLGTMAYSYVVTGGATGNQISSSTNQTLLFPGTQTRAIFNAGNYTMGSIYTIHTDGTVTRTSGGDFVRQYSVPYAHFDTNTELWSRFIILVDPAPAWWTDIQIPATLTSIPSITTINILRNIISTWKSASSTCLGISVPVSSNVRSIWGWPLDNKWGHTIDGYWGVPTPTQPAIYFFGITEDTDQLDSGSGSIRI